MADDDHSIDKHWRRLPDDDPGWTKELRVRSHDIANWAARMEGMIVRLEQKIDRMANADEITAIVEAKVEAKLKRAVVSNLSRVPKLVAAVIMVMQAIILYRGR